MALVNPDLSVLESNKWNVDHPLQLGLIANFKRLIEIFDKCPPLKNLVTAFNNDKNSYSLFLACPVSAIVYAAPEGESEFEQHFGINKVVAFDLASKGIWIYPELKGGVDTVNVFTLDSNDDFGKANLVKSFCIELRYYTHIGAKAHRSKVMASTLLALGINTVVVTNSQVMFGAKQCK